MNNINSDLLIHNIWRLKNTSGDVLQSNLLFKSDGTMDGSSHTNESFWKIDNDCLKIFSKDNLVTSIFNDSYFLGNGFYQLQGNFATNVNVNKVSIDKKDVLLESLLDKKSKKIVSELSVEAKVGKKTDRLIIQFNSVANPFNGNNHEREFNYLTTLAGLDVIRISQSRPLYWYINKVDELEAILSGYILSNYEEVFLLGSSAGGYASILVAEILASKFKNISFTSFSINPQTTLEEKNIKKIYKEFDHYFIPKDVIKQTELEEKQVNSDISEFLKIKKNNVIHHIFYDVLNPVEDYYANEVKFSSRIKLHQFLFGVNHGEGCMKIGGSVEFKDLFLKRINQQVKICKH
ncbi:hypothetical protein ACGTJS_03975 [Faucicola mancuniensis]|uniref:hypothetical protein n=1 Tax=Faucicola mancuniensis TaxID=1309795 RepID=UPI0039776A69